MAERATYQLGPGSAPVGARDELCAANAAEMASWGDEGARCAARPHVRAARAMPRPHKARSRPSWCIHACFACVFLPCACGAQDV